MSTLPDAPVLTLNSAATIPQIGFGTFQIPPEQTRAAVEEALSIGYRHIDTAAGYYNEAGVGEAVNGSGLARDDIFVTTKLRNYDQGANRAREAFERSLDALGLDRVDLYLIHWPVPSADLYVETWEELIRIRDEGLATSIGVSNFLPDHLLRLVDETGVVPAVNQIEAHPLFHRPELRALCRDLGVVVEAYSPLGQGADLADPTVVSIADRIGSTPAQVVLAWHLSVGHVVIPKSVHPDRMAENLAAAAVALSDVDADELNLLHREDGRVGGDPATFSFPQTLEDMKARGE
ncbi:aldo/keto reductase [Actinomyces sp. B33]|uniref:aldo/keto reductase n=1 Tax=Actinomyces sp. B33 TaxID=2942131 RepID=UPI002341337F|nr:aldo/keto reductase [Actinomyces sp. B33]MDC4232720.1 aldo/keto reductase [Actinomyces sp. B33]